MIGSFRSKALKRFWERNDARGINPRWVEKVSIVLDALEAASGPEEMNLSTFHFHPLTGNLAGRYSVTITRNFRITFSWKDENAVHIDLEDYHAR